MTFLCSRFGHCRAIHRIVPKGCSRDCQAVRLPQVATSLNMLATIHTCHIYLCCCEVVRLEPFDPVRSRWDGVAMARMGQEVLGQACDMHVNNDSCDITKNRPRPRRNRDKSDKMSIVTGKSFIQDDKHDKTTPAQCQGFARSLTARQGNAGLQPLRFILRHVAKDTRGHVLHACRQEA